MRAFLVLASLVMLVSAEPPTSYSHRSSNPNLSFQPVPSVAQIHIPHSSSSSQSHSSGQSLYASAASQASPSYAAPSQSYGSPQQSSSQYSVPQRNQQQQQYQPQQQQYNAPQQQQYQTSQSQYQSQSQPANIQVSYGGAPPQLPPGASYGPAPVVTGAGPEHGDIEYRVVYVKGPKARQPDLVLPPPPPKQKTIVYILVPRVEAPEPIIVPTHAPTPPSKPEVYFIRYKATKKNKGGSGGNLGQQYGASSAPKPVVVDAPPKKREVQVSVTSSSSKETKDSESVVDAKPSFSFGDRVRN